MNEERKSSKKKNSKKNKKKEILVSAFKISTEGKFRLSSELSLSSIGGISSCRSIKRMPRNNIFGVLGQKNLVVFQFNEGDGQFSLHHVFENITQQPKFEAKDFTFAGDNILFITQSYKMSGIGCLKIRRQRTYAREIGKLLIENILEDENVEKGEEILTETRLKQELNGVSGIDSHTEYTVDQSITAIAKEEELDCDDLRKTKSFKELAGLKERKRFDSFGEGAN